MKFIMDSILNGKICMYYITINSSDIIYDFEICEYLNIPLEEYQNEIIKFNGYVKDDDIYFHSKEDCQNAFNYVNEKYGVLLVLLGGEI